MNKTEEITKIPIKDIIDRLGINYYSKWTNEFWLYDRDWKTSWRAFNTNKNIVADFSKDRPSGDTFGFVKAKLNLDEPSTFKRFEDNFWTISEKQKQPIRFLWQWLDDIKQEHIDYLKTRWVDYELVKPIIKNYRNAIGCLVYKWWIPKWLRARTLSQEHNKRFFSASWYEWDWIYMHELDETKDYVIVVEWLIDFLTLRQHDTNVVGIVSAQSWYDEIKELSDKYRIIIIPDNDDAWFQWLQQLKWTPYSVFRLNKFWEFKDINDMYIGLSPWKEIISAILDESSDVLPITPIFDWLDLIMKTIKEQWKLGIDWPIKSVYDKCQWVIKGKVYTIWAYSNIGKSKFAYYHVQYFLKQWLKVLFINLEVAAEFCLAEIINSYYWTTRKEQRSWYWVDKSKFRNLIIRDDLFELTDILKEIETSKCDICFIDFVQNVQVKGSKWYDKNAEIAIWIQRTAIRTQSTIYSLSQVANNMAKEISSWTDTIISLKWAWEYYASSDVIFILRKWDEDGLVDLIIDKNKFGRNKLEFNMKVEFDRNQFYLIEKKENPF